MLKLLTDLNTKLFLMKKLLFILLFTSFYLLSFAQVSIRSASSPNLEIAYDSLTNYLDRNKIKAYIGQQLYVKPKSESLTDGGYEDFYTKPNADIKNIYAPIGQDLEASQYDNLAGRTFTVLDIVKGVGKEYNDFLKLTDGEDEIYYLYTPYSTSFPFITLGYLEKLKNNHIGKLFYFTTDVNEYWPDFENGKDVHLISRELWKCTDIILEGKYLNHLECILKNDKGETISILVDHLKFNFLGKEIDDNLKKKYGSLYNKALSGKIWEGMPEELIVLAVGNPDKIINNSSSTGQWVWVYNNIYIYVKNGKVINYYN